jgi:hypothetical protein
VKGCPAHEEYSDCNNVDEGQPDSGDGPSLLSEVNDMAIGVNSSKTGERPAHEAIESNAEATMVGKTAAQKADHEAMESAKRAQNRIHENEEKTPANSMFTK